MRGFFIRIYSEFISEANPAIRCNLFCVTLSI